MVIVKSIDEQLMENWAAGDDDNGNGQCELNICYPIYHRCRAYLPFFCYNFLHEQCPIMVYLYTPSVAAAAAAAAAPSPHSRQPNSQSYTFVRNEIHIQSVLQKFQFKFKTRCLRVEVGAEGRGRDRSYLSNIISPAYEFKKE